MASSMPFTFTGYFPLSNGQLVPNTGAVNTQYATYQTYVISCYSGQYNALANLRLYCPTNQPHPDGLIWHGMARAVGPTSIDTNFLIDYSACENAILVGNPADDAYGQDLPGPDCQFAQIVGHVSSNGYLEITTPLGPKQAFRIDTAEYVQNQTRHGAVYAVFNRDSRRWAKIPTCGPTNSCVSISGHYICRATDGIAVFDVRDVAFNIGSRVGPAIPTASASPNRRRLAPPPPPGAPGSGPISFGGSGGSGSGFSGGGSSGGSLFVQGSSGSSSAPPPYGRNAAGGDTPSAQELADMAGASLRFGNNTIFSPSKRVRSASPSQAKSDPSPMLPESSENADHDDFEDVHADDAEGSSPTKQAKSTGRGRRRLN